MRFYKRNFCYIALVFSALNLQTAMASTATITSVYPPQTLLDEALSSLVVTLSAGPVWENAGDSQTLNLQPDVVKTYSANNRTNSLLAGELFVGVERIINPSLTGQLGLAFAATDYANLSGDIWDDADPAFNNFTYKYQVQHTHVAFKGKLLIDRDCIYAIKPYVSGSLGIAFNRASNFSNTPTIEEGVATSNFTSNTTTAFTYTIGIGVQKDINAHWQAGVGYEFADWGKSELGSAAGQTTNQRITLNHLYTNGLLFNLTWAA